MQITGEIDWNEEEASAAAGARTLDQREEFGAVSSLTAKLSSDGRSPEYHSARDMYQDLDEALPLHWENLTGKGHHKLLGRSADSSEFEFSMSGVAVDPLDPAALSADGVSPADDLFYKGQLLPLHLPKRLQMVQKLSSPKHLDKDDSVTVSCFFQPGSLKYCPGDDGHLGSALVNSRSSSFHSQGSNNYWDSDSPNELDSGDSSSSRDSSGSSNDSVNVPGKQSLPKFNDHVAFQKEGALFQQRDYLECHNNLRQFGKPQFPSWLRTPFRWKLFFGSKKPSRSSADFGSDESSSGSKGMKSSSSPSGLLSYIPRPSGGRTNMKSAKGTYYSAEMKIEGKKEGSSIPFVDEYDRGDTLFLGVGSGRIDVEGSASASKSRESLHKYFNMLKLSSGKAAAASSGLPSSKVTTGQSAAVAADLSGRMLSDTSARPSFSGNLTPSASPQQPSSSFIAAFAKAPQSLSQPQEKLRSSRSPSPFSLAGNLRVPSFSRASKASANASNVTASQASTHHSELLNHNPNTMAELHSAIQGAIAHCKQSQAVSR